MNNSPSEKVFEEVLVSPFEKSSKTEAQKVLHQIRLSHPEEDGWVEILGYVDELTPGVFTAIRHHAKYR